MNAFFTTEFFVKAVSCFVASMAFATLFKIRYKHLLFVGICGMLCYAVYYSIIYFASSFFAAALISTMLVALLSELFARFRHAPVSVCLTPSVVPIVPGADLYYAMRAFVVGDTQAAFENLLVAAKIGFGIAVGIVSISMVFGIITDRIKKADPHKNK